eukprot:TRINITY_DN2581_c0_g1_i1.p1 TRINITY_DN2581_c0_g1~~TRINITY_DN2581_c0_g1_i1.p1  ORF type:complete len:154 (-),score=32.13 TRINITY_DN2581_c0_g1_i1:254-715(-)
MQHSIGTSRQHMHGEAAWAQHRHWHKLCGRWSLAVAGIGGHWVQAVAADTCSHNKHQQQPAAGDHWHSMRHSLAARPGSTAAVAAEQQLQLASISASVWHQQCGNVWACSWHMGKRARPARTSPKGPEGQLRMAQGHTCAPSPHECHGTLADN